MSNSSNAASQARQSGLTMISWLIVIAIGVFFVLIGIKMVPTYMENYSVKQVLASIEEDRSLRGESRSKIRELIKKRLRINGVYDMDEKAFTFTKGKDGLTVAARYEVRKPVAGNVFVVMVFDDAVVIPQ